MDDLTRKIPSMLSFLNLLSLLARITIKFAKVLISVGLGISVLGCQKLLNPDRPQCGVGFSKTNRNYCVYWATTQVTVKLDRSLQKNFSADVLMTVEKSVERWNKPFQSFRLILHPGFVEQREPRREEILVRAEDFQIPDHVQAQTLMNFDGQGRIRGATILFNPMLPYSLEPRGDHFHFESVLDHEIGHALGLDHLPEDGLSLMRPSIRPGEVRTAGYLDWWTIANVYDVLFLPPKPK